jgi:hypothetical protein
VTPEDTKILDFAQQVFLARNNRLNNLTGAKLTEFIDNTITWTNQLVDELDFETDWNWVKTLNDNVGTVSFDIGYDLPVGIRTLVISPYRPLTFYQGSSPIASFKVVSADQIGDPTDRDVVDRVAVVGSRLIFSRQPTAEEIGADIIADSIAYLPKLSHTDVSLFDTVKPLQLLRLGVLKNQTLPDIVQGGISPSFTQKYGDLLQKCITANSLTSEAYGEYGDDFGFIRGDW